MRLMRAAAVVLLLCVFAFSAAGTLATDTVPAGAPVTGAPGTLTNVPSPTGGNLPLPTGGTGAVVPPAGTVIANPSPDANDPLSSPGSADGGTSAGSGSTGTAGLPVSNDTADQPSSGTGASGTGSATGTLGAASVTVGGKALNVTVLPSNASSSSTPQPTGEVLEYVDAWKQLKSEEKTAFVGEANLNALGISSTTVSVANVGSSKEEAALSMSQLQQVLPQELLSAAAQNIETNEVSLGKSIILESVKDANTGEDRNAHKFVIEVKSNSSETLYDVSVVEVVPKEIAEAALAIISPYSFKILRSDPVIEFVIPVMGPGESFSLNYGTGEEIPEQDLNKSTPPVAYFSREGDASAAFAFVLGGDANAGADLNGGTLVEGEVVGQDNTVLYVAGAVAVILVAAIVFVVFRKFKKKPAQEAQQPAEPQAPPAQAASPPAQEPSVPSQPPQPFAPPSDDGIVYPPGQAPPGLGMPPAA